MQLGRGAMGVVYEADIANQAEHHRVRSYQEEFVSLLRKHEIEYDERYSWLTSIACAVRSVVPIEAGNGSQPECTGGPVLIAQSIGPKPL